jgi:hypothetical protein
MESIKRQQEIQIALKRLFESIKDNNELKNEFTKSPEKFIEKYSELKMTEEEINEVINGFNKTFEDLELSEEQMEMVAGGKDGDDEHNGFTWDMYRFIKGLF